MTWSFSRVNSFETCKYSWLLQYIYKEDRRQNYFAAFGLFSHEIMESWWDKEIDTFELSTYYKDNYNNRVTIPAPLFLEKYNFSQRAYDSTLSFYENFDWNRNDFKLLGNEDTIEAEYRGKKLTIRPDTLVRHIPSNEVWLIDYKTSAMFDKKTGKPKRDKLETYKKQLFLYAYFIERERGYKIDKIILVFPKFSLDKNIVIDYNENIAMEYLSWFFKTIQQIEQEENFEANPNKFFCDNLCSVSESCIWKEE